MNRFFDFKIKFQIWNASNQYIEWIWVTFYVTHILCLTFFASFCSSIFDYELRLRCIAILRQTQNYFQLIIFEGIIIIFLLLCFSRRVLKYFNGFYGLKINWLKIAMKCNIACVVSIEYMYCLHFNNYWKIRETAEESRQRLVVQTISWRTRSVLIIIMAFKMLLSSI